MSALTMTLLPEPVAPAMSRCGILARSTACAAPATSRPRANVSFEPDAVKSTSSRIRRSATMLKSLFGISMPTALLPGIGASMRSERAARAIARSSASASMRLTLMSAAGWTSYWVTTGPALRPVIWAGMLKPASLRTMISSLRRCATSLPPASSGRAMSSSRVVAGRTYSIRSRVGGESPASVTSSGSRSGRSGTSTARTGVWTAAPPALAGANVADVGTALGTAAGMSERWGVASAPQIPVWPGDAAVPATIAAPLAGRPPRPPFASALPGPTAVPVPPSGLVARASLSVLVTARPADVNGASSCRNGMSNASSSPTSMIAISTTYAAGTGSRPARRRAPPARARGTPRSGRRCRRRRARTRSAG